MVSSHVNSIQFNFVSTIATYIYNSIQEYMTMYRRYDARNDKTIYIDIYNIYRYIQYILIYAIYMFLCQR